MRYDTKKYLTAVNAVLKSADDDRPVLKTVTHTSDGKQFVCDGFMFVLWNRHIPSLDTLPQTEYSEGKQLNPENVFTLKMREPWTFKVQDHERLIIKHINEYIRLHPTSRNSTGEPIYIFDHFIGSKLLKRFIALIGTDFEEYKTDEKLTSPVNIFTDEISAQILPIRVTDTEEQKRIYKQTEQFIALLKGKELESV